MSTALLTLSLYLECPLPTLVTQKLLPHLHCSARRRLFEVIPMPQGKLDLPSPKTCAALCAALALQ